MATKISVEIDKKKLSVFETKALKEKQKIEILEKEIEYARSRIEVAKAELPLLKENIVRKQILLTQTQEKLLETQVQFVTTNTLIGSEQILYQTLNRSFAELNLIGAKLQYLFTQVLNEIEKEGVQKLYVELNMLEEEQALNSREIEDWEAAADHYLELALAGGNPGEVQLAQDALTLLQKIQRQESLNDYLSTQIHLLIRAKYLPIKDRFIQLWERGKAAFKWAIQWSHKSLFKIGETPITFYGILKIIFIILIAYFLARMVQFWINRIGKRQKKFDQSGVYALGRLLYYAIFVIGIVIAISSIGLDLTTFAFIAGALSVGVGFGLQSIVNNFISGVIVLLEKKLRVGDFIQIESGELGRVMEINVRTTLVRTFDHLEVLVPNADLVSKKFINWTLSDKSRRIRVPFGVAFGSDKNRVKEAAIEAALKIPLTVKEKKPQVWLMKIGESSLDFELVVWVNEWIQESTPLGTLAWYTWEIESALRVHHIKIPYPVRDVNLSQLKEGITHGSNS